MTFDASLPARWDEEEDVALGSYVVDGQAALAAAFVGGSSLIAATSASVTDVSRARAILDDSDGRPFDFRQFVLGFTTVPADRSWVIRGRLGLALAEEGEASILFPMWTEPNVPSSSRIGSGRLFQQSPLPGKHWDEEAERERWGRMAPADPIDWLAQCYMVVLEHAKRTDKVGSVAERASATEHR